MILYHGSNVSIDAIDLSKSRPGKDFGKEEPAYVYSFLQDELKTGKLNF